MNTNTAENIPANLDEFLSMGTDTTEEETTAPQHSATYSPDDDKIRIFPVHRLDSADYATVKAAGFNWAPKQECFYAVWTPNREAVALDFAGEIDDDDSSLLERAEERAERFEDYSDKRATDRLRAAPVGSTGAACQPLRKVDRNIPQRCRHVACNGYGGACRYRASYGRKSDMKTLNETLADLGYTTELAGNNRKNILQGEKIVLAAATAHETWQWLDSQDATP